MTAFPTTHTRMTRLARRMSSSSGLPLPPAKASPYVLDLLGQVRPRAHAAGKAAI
jgi:hypothetical protein